LGNQVRSNVTGVTTRRDDGHNLIFACAVQDIESAKRSRELGVGVTGYKIGDRVLVGAIMYHSHRLVPDRQATLDRIFAS